MSKYKKTNDPLANVRIEAPRGADQEGDDDGAQFEADLEGATPSPDDDPVLSPEAEKQASRDLAAEKKAVVVAAVPKSTTPHYLVKVDHRVFLNGQLIRLKADKSVISDQTHGTGAVERFRAMGVKLEKIEG